MKKKSRITAISLSMMMVFAMAPLTAGVVFANGDGGDGNEGEGGTTDPVKTVVRGHRRVCCFRPVLHRLERRQLG